MKPGDKQYILDNAGKISVKDIADKLGLPERKVNKFLARQKGGTSSAGPGTSGPSHDSKKTVFFSALLIIALGLSVYANTLKGDFIWDDEPLVQNNQLIRSWSGASTFFTKNITIEAGRPWRFYRPLQLLSYAADYSFWRQDVLGYHLTNILLHLCVALAVYWLITILFKDYLIGFLTGVLFVIHPIHTEAVAYISGRADPLAGLFMILCFVFYVRSFNVKGKVSYPLAFICFLSAILSKESGLILPVLLLLYHYTFRKKINAAKFLPLIGLVIVYYFLRSTVLPEAAPILHRTTFSERVPGFFVATAEYTRLLLLPFDLHMEYGYKQFAFTDPSALAGLLILLGIGICIFLFRKKNTLVFFALAWIILTILPVSNLYPINAYMAEHWLYLPSIGFFLILGKGLSVLFRAGRSRTVSIVLMMVLVGFFSYRTVKQNRYWKDPITFFETTLRYASEPRLYNNLANAYASEGRTDEAIVLYQKAVARDPDYAGAHYNLGVIYKDIGRNAEAAQAFQRAVEIDPRHTEAYNNLGIVYGFLTRTDDAVRAYKKVIQLNPGHAPAHNNLGTVFRRAGEHQKAISLFRKAVAIDPEYAVAYFNLGNTYNAIDRTAKAIDAYKKAIKSDPAYADAYYGLGIVLNKTGDQNSAIEAYNKAVRVDPGNAKAYNNLAAIYLEKGQFQLAVKYCDKAKALGLNNGPLLKALEPYR